MIVVLALMLDRESVLAQRSWVLEVERVRVSEGLGGQAADGGLVSLQLTEGGRVHVHDVAVSVAGGGAALVHETRMEVSKLVVGSEPGEEALPEAGELRVAVDFPGRVRGFVRAEMLSFNYYLFFEIQGCSGRALRPFILFNTR